MALPRRIPAKQRSYLLAVGIVLWIGIMALVALDLVTSRRALETGLAQVRSTRAEITTASLKRNPLAVLTYAEARLGLAQSDFQRADDGLAPLAPILSRMTWVPRYGPELADAAPAAHLARRSTDAAIALVRGLRPLRTQVAFIRTHRGQKLQVSQFVVAIASGRKYFSQACADMSDATASRTQLSGATVPQIAQALGAFDREAGALRMACRVLYFLPMLLGYPHPYRYIVGYQDPLQIRAAGGFLGTAGLLTMHNGHAGQQFLSTFIRDNLSVPPPEPMQLYDREPGWLFRDSNWSPDFPTTAALERFFARLDLGWQAPAIINLTPKAVADALLVLGPFYSTAYHRIVDGGNVTTLTDYYTHHAKSYFGPLAIADASTRRKQFIQIVAAHIFRQVRTLTPSQFVRLALGLAPDVASGDLQFNFRNSALQAVLASAHASGAVDHGAGDYLYLVDSNLSDNKINPYVHLSAQYTAHIQANRWIHAELTLRFQNTEGPPSAYDEAGGPGFGRLGGPKDYADYVRILVPAGSYLLHTAGWTQPWTPGPAYGREMFAGYVIVPVNTSRTVRLRYLIPPNVFLRLPAGKYRLSVQHQPGSALGDFKVAVFDGKTPVVARTGAPPGTDWSVSGSIARKPFRPILVPAQPRTIVAPGHFVEPHAYLKAPSK